MAGQGEWKLQVNKRLGGVWLGRGFGLAGQELKRLGRVFVSAGSELKLQVNKRLGGGLWLGKKR